VIAVRTLLRRADWSRASNERARANARTAATACGRARVERAEVAAYLARVGAQITPSNLDHEVKTRAEGR
jgi:hypothetical protein